MVTKRNQSLHNNEPSWNYYFSTKKNKNIKNDMNFKFLAGISTINNMHMYENFNYIDVEGYE